MAAPVRNSEILDVHKVAALATVSSDTVYELLKSGELPGRKGRAQVDHDEKRGDAVARRIVGGRGCAESHSGG